MSGASSIRRALLSVSDKRGLVDFARALADRGVDLLSTGGSARVLRDAGLTVVDVAAHTGFPEVMDGRVKTLHPAIHGGILARRDHAGDRAAMDRHGIAPIDLVAINLYPFEATRAAGGGFADCIESIDIGGPALVRAAAKNHAHVTVVVDPDDYPAVLDDLADGVSGALRRRLAAKAYARTAAYDAAIARWFAAETGETFPEWLTLAGTLKQTLRYGENPHQAAAVYVTGPARSGVVDARQVQGRELSYNNLDDTDAAVALVAEFDDPAVAIVKHANPCGVALGNEAHARALACDPVSAFGGIVATNRPLDRAAAEAITQVFTEVVIAPDIDAAALPVFAARKNLRLLLTAAVSRPVVGGMTVRTIAGGLLVQDRDAGRIGDADLTVVTRRAPTDAERADLLFAFRVAKHVKSNAIVYARDGATVGIGAGQMSRVDASRIAAEKAASGVGTQGSVVASDGFFPFADGLESAIAAGATAVIQPGGSVRDDEVIAAADKAGVAMVFTGMRHFRH